MMETDTHKINSSRCVTTGSVVEYLEVPVLCGETGAQLTRTCITVRTEEK